MPRKNHTPPHTPYRPQSATEPQKRRFPTQRAALNAIQEIQRYRIGVELSVYRSPVDGGWYLTSSK